MPVSQGILGFIGLYVWDNFRCSVILHTSMWKEYIYIFLLIKMLVFHVLSVLCSLHCSLLLSVRPFAKQFGLAKTLEICSAVWDFLKFWRSLQSHELCGRFLPWVLYWFEGKLWHLKLMQIYISECNDLEPILEVVHSAFSVIV